jgi:peptidoglycan/LPS O-acetylase OafA/YrhL
MWRRGLHLRIESASALTSIKSTDRYYPEIDGLRAVAVILVILYHFGYSNFTGGFIGVDVFFVISGYLITNLLIDSPAHHGVGLASFYIRRAKRLAPALLFFLFVCLACGYALLSPGDYTSLAASSLFASVGASNFYFFYHTGYFDPSAQSLPLLHTWSLAIEEQFYLFWPISLFLLRKLCKGRSGVLITILAALTVVSFCVNLDATATDQKLGFYFPFGRAWELSVGGLLAIFHASMNARCEVHGRERRVPLAMQLLPAVGLVLMLAAALAFDEHDPYPGWRALLPVFGTIAYLIPVGQRTLVYSLMASAPPRLVGKASYSIYLYHWSLLTFFRYYTDFTPISPSDRLELVIASLALGFISWRLIEQPFRYARWTGKLQAALLGGAGLAVAGFSVFIWLNDGLPGRLPESVQTMRSLAAMWEWKCARESGLPSINVFGEDADWNQCETGKPWDHASKKIIVLGDSHATQLMPLITSMIGERDLSIRLFIICSPIIDGVTYVDFNNYKRNLSCKARHEFAIDYLRTQPVDVVVLASAWTFIPRQLVHDFNDKTQADDANRQFTRGFEKVINDLRGASEAPIFVLSDIPMWNADPVPCYLSDTTTLFRRKTSKEGCPHITNYATTPSFIHDYFRSFPGIQLISPESYLCNTGGCRTIVNGEFIYRDLGHFRRNLKPDTMRELAALLHLDRIIAASEH